MSYRCPADVKDSDAPNGIRKCKNYYDPSSGAKDCGVHASAVCSVMDTAVYTKPLQDCSAAATLDMDDLVASSPLVQPVTLEPDFLRGAREVASKDHERTHRILDDVFEETGYGRAILYSQAGYAFGDLIAQNDNPAVRELIHRTSFNFAQRREADAADANALAASARACLDWGAEGEASILDFAESRMNSLAFENAESDSPEERALQIDTCCKSLLAEVNDRMWELEHQVTQAKGLFTDRAHQIFDAMENEKSYDFQTLQGSLGYYSDLSSVMYAHDERRRSLDESYQRSWRLFQEAETRRGQIAREISSQVTRRRAELLDSLGLSQYA